MNKGGKILFDLGRLLYVLLKTLNAALVIVELNLTFFRNSNFEIRAVGDLAQRLGLNVIKLFDPALCMALASHFNLLLYWVIPGAYPRVCSGLTRK